MATRKHNISKRAQETVLRDWPLQARELVTEALLSRKRNVDCPSCSTSGFWDNEDQRLKLENVREADHKLRINRKAIMRRKLLETRSKVAASIPSKQSR